MSKNLYIGIDGVARRVKRAYIGVDGVARRVKAGYRGANGLARQFFKAESLKITVDGTTYIAGVIPEFTSNKTFTVTGSGMVSLILVGGGGGGGLHATSQTYNGEGGKAGEKEQTTLELTEGTYTITIGALGAAATTSSNSGNGGDTSISKSGTALLTAAGGSGGTNGKDSGYPLYDRTGGEAQYGTFGAGGTGGYWYLIEWPGAYGYVFPTPGTAGVAVITI